MNGSVHYMHINNEEKYFDFRYEYTHCMKQSKVWKKLFELTGKYALLWPKNVFVLLLIEIFSEGQYDFDNEYVLTLSPLQTALVQSKNNR